VIAIGNPLGLDQTLTRGIVSAINRILPISPMSLTIPMIQTDAAINPGNSGGPLINRCGRVIGMNTSVLAPAENIGFALPAEIIKQVLSELIRNGRVIRPWVGIRGQLIQKKDIQAIFNFDVVNGFLIETIDPGSPAEKAELRGGVLPIKVAGQELLFGGDIIVSANGKSLDNQLAYETFVTSLKVGDNVKLTVYREGKKHRVSWVLPERPVLPGDIPNECSAAFQYE
jgi:serine protease Do